MKKLALACMALTLIAFGTSAQAQRKTKKSSSEASTWTSSSYSTLGSAYIHEVDLNLSQAEIHSFKKGSKSYTDMNAVGSYNRLIQDKIQVGALAGFFTYPDASDDNKLYFALMGTGTYNLESDLDNSIFGTAGIGLYPSWDKDDGERKSAFSFMVGAGKRFKIFDHVHYKPEFRIEKLGSEDASFRILVLNVSLMF